MKYKLFVNNVIKEYTIVWYKDNGIVDRTFYQPSIKDSYLFLIQDRLVNDRDNYIMKIESQERHTLLFEFSDIKEFESKFIEYLV